MALMPSYLSDSVKTSQLSRQSNGLLIRRSRVQVSPGSFWRALYQSLTAILVLPAFRESSSVGRAFRRTRKGHWFKSNLIKATSIGLCSLARKYGHIAQQVERWPEEPSVGSSILSVSTVSLAQWQSGGLWPHMRRFNSAMTPQLIQPSRFRAHA